MKTLLIVWHSRTGGAKTMSLAAARGARQAGDVRVRRLTALSAKADDVLAADGYLFVAPENLASLSGGMKEFFDRTYYGVLGRIEGRPYAQLICAGSDGEGAVRQVARIATGWRLQPIAEPFIVNVAAQTPEAILAPKSLPPEALARCEEIGATLAAGLSIGMF
jgi:multimeric flavodoxin WrbA